MSDIKPYINQQNWGRDLLNKIATLLDVEGGGINTWLERPTEGKDGLPLDSSHAGYTGINVSGQPVLEQWDGEKWITVFKVPIESVGEGISIKSYEDSAAQCSAYAGSFDDDFIYVAKANVDGFIRLSKIDKTTAVEVWETSATLLSPNLHAEFVPNSAWRKAFGIQGERILFLCKQIPDRTANPNLAGDYRLFAFNHSGALLWFQDFSVSASQYFFDLIQGPNNEIIIFRVDPASASISVRVIDANSGIIKRTNTLSFAGQIYFSSTYYDFSVNSYVVTYAPINTGASIRIAKINTEFSSILNEVVVGTTTSISVNSFGVKNPYNSSLTYFTENLLEGGSRIVVYNNGLQSVAVLGNYPKKLDPLFGVYQEQGTNDLIFVVSNESVFLGYKISNNLVSFYSVYALWGNGDILIPGQKGVFDPSKVAAKQLINLAGDVTTRSRGLSIYLSFPNAQISYLQNGFISSSPDFEAIRRQFNFPSGFIKDLVAEILFSNSIQSPQVDPVSTPIESLSPFPLKGVASQTNTGGYHLFWGELSGESQSYVAGSRPRTAGLLLGCQNVGGRIIHGFASDASAAIILDHFAGRLLIGVNPSPTLSGSILTGFPNANGFVVTTLNNVGLGSYSPAYKLDVVGTIRGTEIRNSGGVVTSDEAMKLGITPLDGANLWELFGEIIPISFLYRPDFFVTKYETQVDEDGNGSISESIEHWPLPTGIQFGYSAQQVEEVLPELVSIDPSTGIRYLAKDAIHVCFQAAATHKINTLQEEVDGLKTQVNQMASLIDSLTDRLSALENS